MYGRNHSLEIIKMIVKSPFYKLIEIEKSDSDLINQLVNDCNIVLKSLTNFETSLDCNSLFEKFKSSRKNIKARHKDGQYYQIIGSDLVVNIRLKMIKTEVCIESISYKDNISSMNVKIRSRKQLTVSGKSIISLSYINNRKIKDLLLGIDYSENCISVEHTLHPDARIFNFMRKNYAHWPHIDESDIIHAKMSL